MNASLLRIELRRSTVLLALPLMAVLVGLSPTQRHLSALALWPDRSIDLQTALQGAGPLFAGTAAWMAGRERRRGMEDLLATTPRSPWTRLLATWTATTLWGLLFYLAVGAVVFGVTAAQAAWGGAVPWPALEGLLAMLACSTLGFALGHHCPGRFTPPLVGVGVFVALGLGITLVNHGDKIGYLVALTYPSVTTDDSIWYADRPDLVLVQAIFLLGLTGAGLGSLGLMGPGRATLQATRPFARVLAVAGLALAGASVALVMGSRVDNGMVRVPLFGGPATNMPLSYTPVCYAAPLPVCVHPAYRAQLAETATLLNHIAAPVLGLPGAPTRAAQRPATAGVVSDGTQRVLAFTPIDFHDPTNPPQLVRSWVGRVAVSLVADGLPATGRRWTTDKAQNAVAVYLLRCAGAPFEPTQFDPGQDVTAAEHRFAALPARARQSWLRAHYALLRQRRGPLEELP